MGKVDGAFIVLIELTKQDIVKSEELSELIGVSKRQIRDLKNVLKMY